MERNTRTIVGGRAAVYPQMGTTPRGLEVLLKKAKVDAAFRERFLRDPAASAHEIDLELTPSEKEVLFNTPRSILKSMIDNTFVPRHHVSTFLQKSSAAMLALLLGSIVIIPTHATGIQEKATYQDISEVDLAQARMASIQAALEQYRLDHGSYPATDAWVSASNPLDGYLALANLWDPWMRKFHYEAVENKAGEAVNYLLESLGPNADDPTDNIPCPTEPERHSFSRNQT